MIEVLAAHSIELEKELRERVLAFFAENDETPDSATVEMKLTRLGQDDGI